MQIPLGKAVHELMGMRKETRSWDPNGQMPWSKTMTVSGDNGRKYKVEVKLNSREKKKDANI